MSQGWAMPLIRAWHINGGLFGWSMGPTVDQTSEELKYGKIIVHSMPGRHHPQGCRSGTLDVDP